jgi:hypothetical protein
MVTTAENDHIEQLSAAQMRRGYNGGATIVYRDAARVGLGLAVVANGHFAGPVDVRLSPKLDWCVIGTQEAADNKAIRAKVTALAAALGG